jgi:hypothetical protein
VTPQPITDEALDQIIETARPYLRKAIRESMTNLVPMSMFEIAKIPLPSGQLWSLMLAIMTEPVSGLVQGTVLHGMPALMAGFQKMQTAPPPAVPAAPASRGFKIPA